MKTPNLILIASLLAGSLHAQTADQDMTNGLAYLAATNLVAANQQFVNALALSPTNESANALIAVTRLLLLPTTTAGSNFLNSWSYSTEGRNIYDWTSSLPVDVDGRTLAPTNNTSAIVAFYSTNIMPALAASRSNLDLVTDPNFTLPLTTDETSWQAVTVDYGDILMLQALECAAEFVGQTAAAENDGVVISKLVSMGKAGELTLESGLALYPKLLTLADTGELAASKGTLTNAIALYFAASDFIRNVRAPGAPALFVLSDDETNHEALFRTELTNVLASLNGPAQFSAPAQYAFDPFTLNTSNYFSGTITLRSLLPKFNGNYYVNNSMPDYTFGGILPEEPAYLTEKTVREVFNYAGIYDGEGGLFDDNGGYGDFALFLSTNQVATIVGTDNGDGSDDGSAFAVLVQVSMSKKAPWKNGHWEVNNDTVSGTGRIGWHGSLSGELDYANGTSVYLSGSRQSPLGPFQNAAGYYSGKIQGGTATALYGVLAADGEINFCPALSGGTADTGGSAQFDANNHFQTDIVSATVLAGTLNTNTLAINGTFTNNHTGTWSLNRTANVPFDLPPVITKSPPTVVPVPLGNTVAISLVATGSAPMCYQWKVGTNAIPYATTNALIITNVQYADAGTYSISINNCAGGTNAAVILQVVQETNPPTLQITSPTPGLQVGSALYTIVGTAADNLGVSNVWVQFNQAGWNLATTTNQWTNWTVQVALNPGTNTIQAYAINTLGIVSPITNVVFKYVASAPLTVNINGGGAVVTNYNGDWLVIGQTYSMTARPGTGFAFKGWTGSETTNQATLRFLMTSNLVFTANFADVTRPSNSITAPVAKELVSNAVFTVAGQARDNAAVANVFYAVNHGGWNVATTTNQWTNWTAQVVLAPDTNMVQAFAVDTSGNISATNTVVFEYVLTAPLTVQLAGKGTVSPNDSNVLLQVGSVNRITAAPVAGWGFAFSNWTGGVGQPLAVLTNSPTLQFAMVSNLVLQANFRDTSPPTNAITLPAANQGWSNYVITVTGKAGDNLGVVGVWYQLNGGAWAMAGTTNGYTNWNTPAVAVVAGTNRVGAYAADAAGNVSLTNWVAFRCVLPPVGSAYIPGGSFRMGNTIPDNDISDAAPTNVYVSAFYMDTNLVSYSQWQTVYDWATNHGYAFANAGAGKGANQPVQGVDWYDVLKWNNARSQQGGWVPVYYTDTNATQIYTNGEPAEVYAKWSGGYRLPTEAEWEKAARGGVSGQRFPWGNLIAETNANYDGDPAGYNYDFGPAGYNVIGSVGGTSPATSPVGSFAANGYGIYDLAGNVYEWCWDWLGMPYGQPATNNPTGPAAGSYRVIRGGAWDDEADTCRVAARGQGEPAAGGNDIGFRSVMSVTSNSVPHWVPLVAVAPRMTLSAPQWTAGRGYFSFVLSGPAGSNYVLQVSTNLLNWSPVSTSTIPAGGTLTLTNASSGDSRRFYRTSQQ